MFNACVEWLIAPLSGSLSHQIDPNSYWHGRLMVIAWSLLVPVAIIVARFYKVTPGQNWPTELDNKFWWHMHRYSNIFAVSISIIGIYLVYANNRYVGELRGVHGMLGWLVVLLCFFQLVVTRLRGTKGGPTAPRLDDKGAVIDLYGDHDNMTLKRKIFEYLHKSLGHILWLLALITTFLGMLVADAPRWMFVSIAVWWTFLLLLSIYLQTKGRCLDTYQAIWGIDKNMPGYSHTPIGWGVNRRGD